MRTRVVTALVAVVLAVGVGAGCGLQDEYNDDRGKGDAGSDQQPDRDRKVWPNADGFPNISAFCVGANGVYTTTGAPEVADMVVVVTDDPECAEGGVLQD